MVVRVNGTEMEVAEGATVSSLLATLDLPAMGVAVELNRNIVKRDLFGATILADGDQVEIVHFVGGG
jgi:sulfur carrier protein